MFRTVVLFSILCLVSTLKHPDEVEFLPGLNFPLNYKHYSGYLNATKGRYLHYWFVESQNSPSTDPVLLWLNGGPGCSSFEGMLEELGPLRVSSDGKTLYNNTFSWNREANVIFLESPAGVGFSYADDLKYETDDDSVSNDSYLALQHFFKKFPQFEKNDFYISGESYAGVYVPTLAVRVLKGPAKINLKGYAIGNGMLDVANMTDSLFFFVYHHGLIATEQWKKLVQHCCVGGIAVPENCDFDRRGFLCMFYSTSLILQVYKSKLNAYNLYANCADSSEANSRYLVNRRNTLQLFPMALHKLGKSPNCINSTKMRKYLNQPEVRKALHVPEAVQAWDICSDTILYSYKKLYGTMRPQILQLAKSGIRGIIYNGDVDMACNFLGDMWFAESLGLKVRSAYTEWYYNDQIAGFVKYYDKLTFLTVKGAGHMVPQDKPAEALHMITKFLNEESF